MSSLMRQTLTSIVTIFFSFHVYSQTNEEKLIKFLNDTISKDPKNSEMLFIRGLGFQEAKKYDKAVSDFTASLKYLHEFKLYGHPSNSYNKKPLDSSDVLHTRAYCYDEMDSINNSVSDYRFLQTEKPNDFFYPIAVARLYIKHKLFDNAQTEIDNIKNKNTERGLVQQAILYYEIGKNQQALTEIDAALKKDPGSIEGLIAKGKILIKLNRQVESCKYFEEAKSKMTLAYFGGKRGYQHDFEKDIENLKTLYCK